MKWLPDYWHFASGLLFPHSQVRDWLSKILLTPSSLPLAWLPFPPSSWALFSSFSSYFSEICSLDSMYAFYTDGSYLYIFICIIECPMHTSNSTWPEQNSIFPFKFLSSFKLPYFHIEEAPLGHPSSPLTFFPLSQTSFPIRCLAFWLLL